jgi:hypothetical protein
MKFPTAMLQGWLLASVSLVLLSISHGDDLGELAASPVITKYQLTNPNNFAQALAKASEL